VSGKGKVYFRIYLYLTDPFDLIFNGIFNGDYVDIRHIDGRKDCIKRSCLSAACGAGDKDNTIRRLDKVFNGIEFVRYKSEIRK